MKEISEATIESLLEWQEIEFRSRFDATNFALHEVIWGAAETELLRAGAELICAPEAARRILGIRLLRELVDLAVPAAEQLATMLSGERDDEVLSWIVTAFGFLESTTVTDRLVTLSSHASPGIRYHVATALGNNGSGGLAEEGVTALLALCHDTDAEVRFSAVSELGSFWDQSADTRAEDVLISALADDDPLVARTAAEALGAGMIRRVCVS